ncbi:MULTISPECIES: hypothetical protein [Caballeronia]|uniref:hypothetical protein n=1 Tax=Caballeronia TaxID=1827195 RepID=UPI00158C78DC|nr:MULTISPECIES: hypothetical protein [Caballeronia]MCG7403577.1 hypothetical protein [Caballeronia zhejiangensis]MCI1044795.1 hypothetical protein [Caballeronia zhejiangensis]
MKSPANVVSYLALGIFLFAAEFYTLGMSTGHSPLMLVSHVLLLGVVLFHLGMHLFDSKPSFADASVVVFEITFLILAPALQLAHDAQVLVNTMPFDDTSALHANLIFIVFIVTYLGARHLLPRTIQASTARASEPLTIRYAALIPALAICVVAAMSAFNFASQLQAGDLDGIDVTPLDMIRAKVLFFLIVPVFILIVLHRPRRIGLVWIALALFAFVLLLICQNPLTEKRNALGPIYLTLLALAFQRHLKSPSRVFWAIFVLSGLFFPFSELFTNSRIDKWPLSWATIESFFEEHFASTTYDAWANTEAIVEMVSREGINAGRQLAGSLLFFVPHAVWPDKPLATAILVGEYLQRNYSMWFLNLSAPLPAEGYFDFSWAGVVAYGFLLGYFSRRADALVESPIPLRRALGCYLSFYVVFVLRGSLMVAVAYVVPVLVTFQLVSVLLTSRENRRAEPRTARPLYSGMARRK